MDCSPDFHSFLFSGHGNLLVHTPLLMPCLVEKSITTRVLVDPGRKRWTKQEKEEKDERPLIFLPPPLMFFLSFLWSFHEKEFLDWTQNRLITDRGERMMMKLCYPCSYLLVSWFLLLSSVSHHFGFFQMNHSRGCEGERLNISEKAVVVWESTAGEMRIFLVHHAWENPWHWSSSSSLPFLERDSSSWEVKKRLFVRNNHESITSVETDASNMCSVMPLIWCLIQYICLAILSLDTWHSCQLPSFRGSSSLFDQILIFSFLASTCNAPRYCKNRKVIPFSCHETFLLRICLQN
jgi:hypothetical protein